jgi:heme oxygenase (mycobilin-producing)
MSPNRIAAHDRVAPASDHILTGPVTLMNSFAVRPDQDEAFRELWTKTARYFTARPGFISLRLHRAASADAPYRWVNVANWESEAHFRAAHGTDEFRRVVTQPGWEEFPSSPMLYQVVAEVG